MNLNIQIFGTPKCKDTSKAIRFFKERGIKVHFVDLNEKGISPGELDNISNKHSYTKLIDSKGRLFDKMNLKYMTYDERDILLENPLLLITPIVRNGKLSTVGHKPEIWKDWIDMAKK